MTCSKNRAMEIGLETAAPPRRAAELARTFETLGFATLLLPDSQSLAPDVWQQLALAAQATSRIRLGPGVTNPVTRDVAVTANAAWTLQIESRGRVVLGLGRGDSAVQRIGKPSMRLADFERYVVELQAYLSGATVVRDGFPSRFEWPRAADVTKVPLEIAATGPKVIALAARHADRIGFAVGADPGHLGWALETARAAARAAGRDLATLRFGAFVNCVVHPDPAVARAAIRGTVATFARFSSFGGAPLDHLPPPLRDAAAAMRARYDMRDHTQVGAAHTAALEDAFLDWYAVAGSVAYVRERLERIAALGLDFCHVVPGSFDTPRDVLRESLRLLGTEVLPAFAA
jgi:5,10-methylenetetrahydromethanopterin reductase